MKHFKLLLQSLFKNSACVEGGRTYPWWVAVLFFILSTAISLIPTTVSIYTSIWLYKRLWTLLK
jgi:maltodextrin utilization protein YvdJ